MDPFDSRMSETTRTVYGNLSSGGMIGISERSASAPWPTSRRPGAAQKRDFADRERREVVVQHEALVDFARRPSRLLLVSAVPSVAVTSACVSPRVNTAEPCVRGSTPDFDRDRAGSRRMRVHPAGVLRSSISSRKHFLLELLEDGLGLDPALDLAFGQRRDEVVEHLVDAVVVLELAANPHRLAERDQHLLFDLAVELVAAFLRGVTGPSACRSRGPSRRSSHDLPDGGVTGFECANHFVFD